MSGPDNDCVRIFRRARRNIHALCPDASAKSISAPSDHALCPAVRGPASVLFHLLASAHRFDRGAWPAHSKHFFPRADHPPRRPVSIARDDSKYGTGPCPESPAIPQPKALLARAREANEAALGPPGCAANLWLTSFG